MIPHSAFRIPHSDAWRWLSTVPAALLMAAFLALPALLGLFTTFTASTPIGEPGPLVGLDNYRTVLSDSTMGAAFVNVLTLTAIVVPIELALGLAVAALLRRPFPGRSLVRVLLLAPWLVSPLAAGVMWHFLYDGQVGLVAWVAGVLHRDVASPPAQPSWALLSVALMEIWRMAPLAAFLLLPGVLAVPQDDIDQAVVMGSPALITWWVAIIPRIRALLLTVLLLLVAQSLTTFDSIFVLTGGGPGSRTITPAMQAYNLAVQGHNWSLGATASWLLAALVLVAGAIYIRLVRAEPV
jgi:multiple sugar transport system permease protein